MLFPTSFASAATISEARILLPNHPAKLYFGAKVAVSKDDVALASNPYRRHGDADSALIWGRQQCRTMSRSLRMLG
jgi:hypothetical protein